MGNLANLLEKNKHWANKMRKNNHAAAELSVLYENSVASIRNRFAE